jgi:hypothetical protein
VSDAPEGAELEAADLETVDIEWLGHTVTLPASAEDWDINVLRAFRAGDVIGVIEQLLAPGEFARIEKAHRAAHGGRFLAREMKPLGDRIAELYGFSSLGK